MTIFPHKGFSLIELLVVIAVSIALLIVIFSGLSSFRSTTDLNRTLDGVLAELREARQRSIESQDQTQWGVHFESGRAVLFSGSAYISGAATNSPFVLPATVTVSAVAFTGGVTDVVFSRIVGESSVSGTVTIALTRDASVTRVVIVHSSGLAEVQ